MKILAIPHEPTPLVVFQVFLPYGTAVGDDTFAAWRDAAWSMVQEVAEPKLKTAIERLVAHVPYGDLIGIRELASPNDAPHPKIDARALDTERSTSLLERTEGPRFAIFTRNADDFDPLPYVLAWVTANGVAHHERGVCYAHATGRIWDPREEPPIKLAGSLPVRSLLAFEMRADDHHSFVATAGLCDFGLPELSWTAPADTDVPMMRNVVVATASALLRLRRANARRAPGQATLEVPGTFPVLLGDIATAYGIDVTRITSPAPDTQLFTVPLDLSTAHDLAIVTNASARALNEWLRGLREHGPRSFEMSGEPSD